MKGGTVAPALVKQSRCPAGLLAQLARGYEPVHHSPGLRHVSRHCGEDLLPALYMGRPQMMAERAGHCGHLPVIVQGAGELGPGEEIGWADKTVPSRGAEGS